MEHVPPHSTRLSFFQAQVPVDVYAPVPLPNHGSDEHGGAMKLTRCPDYTYCDLIAQCGPPDRFTKGTCCTFSSVMCPAEKHLSKLKMSQVGLY